MACQVWPLDGDEGTRTPDLRLAKAPLSQLSYIPVGETVGLTGLEPVTSRLSGVRSNQLSYRPMPRRNYRVNLRPLNSRTVRQTIPQPGFPGCAFFVGQ